MGCQLLIVCPKKIRRANNFPSEFFQWQNLKSNATAPHLTRTQQYPHPAIFLRLQPAPGKFSMSAMATNVPASCGKCCHSQATVGINLIKH